MYVCLVPTELEGGRVKKGIREREKLGVTFSQRKRREEGKMEG